MYYLQIDTQYATDSYLCLSFYYLKNKIKQILDNKQNLLLQHQYFIHVNNVRYRLYDNDIIINWYETIDSNDCDYQYIKYIEYLKNEAYKHPDSYKLLVDVNIMIKQFILNSQDKLSEDKLYK